MAKKKKLIELIIDETAEHFGVDAISIVKFPAVEENFVFFNNDFLSLAKVDEEKKQLVGAILIPEKRIPRLDKETNEEYEVFFTKETIRQAQKLFMNSLNNNNHTFEHKEPIQGLTVVESWIKEDKKYDKSLMYGFKNLPIGTWFVQVSAENNTEIWEAIKNKEVRGFSIEGYFTDKLIEASKEVDILDEVCEECPDEVMMGKIKNLILDNELNPVGALDGEPLFRTKEEAEIYAEMFKGCSGSHPHTVDGVKLFMPCVDHASATMREEMEGDHGKKKKRKRKYKMLEYVAYAKRKAMLKYSWDDCMRDQMKEYGNKETAAKVCAAIKNRTVRR